MKTFIDLFCGVGGFHIPLAERGLECVFASEIDRHAAESYEANFGLKPHGDITEIDAAAIPAHDVLCAGFPCQPFSNSGSGLGMKDVRGGLFYEIVRIATHCQPKILLLENVPTILTIDNGNVLKLIRDSLDEAGYRVNYSVLNSGAYGIPQSRLRCYFVCIRKDLLLSFTPPPPLPMAQLKCVNDITLPDEKTAHLILERDDIYFHKRLNQGRVYKLNLIGGIGKCRQGEMIYNPAGLAPTQTVECGRGGIFLMESESGDKIKRPSQAMRIFDGDSLATTQMANGHGLAANGGLYLVNKNVRTLHIDEVKLVMGFPITHFVSKGRQGFRQMGNAVIPAMVGFIYDGIQEATNGS